MQIKIIDFGFSKILGNSDDPRAVRPLIDLFSNVDPEIRLSVTTALGCLKSSHSDDGLIFFL